MIEKTDEYKDFKKWFNDNLSDKYYDFRHVENDYYGSQYTDIMLDIYLKLKDQQKDKNER